MTSPLDNPDWLAGAQAEADARNEGLSVEACDVRHALEGLACLPHHSGNDAHQLVMMLARIYGPVPGRHFTHQLWRLWRSHVHGLARRWRRR